MELNTKKNNSLYKWLDENYEPNKSVIKNNSWKSIPIFKSLTPLETEWLSESIKKEWNSESLLAIDVQFNKEPKVKWIENNRDAIYSYLALSDGYVILTNEEESFLFYKDQLNRFSLLCGNDTFLKVAFPASKDTQKIMYFFYWKSDPVYTSGEKKEFLDFWNKYVENPEYDKISL